MEFSKLVTRPRMQRLTAVAQWVAVLLVSVPALGIAFLSLREGVTEPGGMSLNRAFHVVLGLALLLLLADAFIAIRRSARPELALLMGTGGFLAALGGGVLSEVLGPPALLLLLAGGVIWALALLRSKGRPGIYARSFDLTAEEPGAIGAVWDD